MYNLDHMNVDPSSMYDILKQDANKFRLTIP